MLTFCIIFHYLEVCCLIYKVIKYFTFLCKYNSSSYIIYLSSGDGQTRTDNNHFLRVAPLSIWVTSPYSVISGYDRSPTCTSIRTTGLKPVVSSVPPRSLSFVILYHTSSLKSNLKVGNFGIEPNSVVFQATAITVPAHSPYHFTKILKYPQQKSAQVILVSTSYSSS